MAEDESTGALWGELRSQLESPTPDLAQLTAAIAQLATQHEDGRLENYLQEPLQTRDPALITAWLQAQWRLLSFGLAHLPHQQQGAGPGEQLETMHHWLAIEQDPARVEYRDVGPFGRGGHPLITFLIDDQSVYEDLDDQVEVLDWQPLNDLRDRLDTPWSPRQLLQCLWLVCESSRFQFSGGYPELTALLGGLTYRDHPLPDGPGFTSMM